MGGVRVSKEQYEAVKKWLSKGLLQKDVVDITGLDKSTISRIANGKYDHLFGDEKSNYVKELVPKTDDEKYFDISSSLNMLQILIDQTIQQNDEIIDLLNKLAGAWGVDDGKRKGF